MLKDKACNNRVRRVLKTRLLGTAAFFTAVLLSLAVVDPVRGETLEDAFVAAYSGNPELESARTRLRAIDEGVPEARAGWLPTVSLTGSYGYTDRRSSPSFALTPRQKLHPFNGGAEASQTLFRGGRIWNTVKRAKADVRAGRADLRSVEQSILLNVVTAYMDVLRDQSVVELNRNNVAVLRRQLEATEDRFKVGELTRTDVAQAEARLSGAISALTRAESNLIGSRASYERTVGQTPATLSAVPPAPEIPSSEEEALATALDRSPVLVGAREREIASRFGVAVAKGALLPTVSLRGELSHNEQTSTRASQSDTMSVVAQISIPLYQGGAEYAQVRRARQTNNQSRLDIAAAEREVREAVANSWELLRSARGQIVSDRELVRANEIAYDGVRQEAQVGSRTTLDVLDAEQELLDARVSLVSSERTEYVAVYQLLASMGVLAADYLGLAVDVYDPAAYYDKVKFKFIGWDTQVHD